MSTLSLEATILSIFHVYFDAPILSIYVYFEAPKLALIDRDLFFLQVIAPQFKHFQKLRDLVEMRLPPGFPVKVDLPIFPTISARITFHDFEWKNGTGRQGFLLFFYQHRTLKSY